MELQEIGWVSGYVVFSYDVGVTTSFAEEVETIYHWLFNLLS